MHHLSSLLTHLVNCVDCSSGCHPSLLNEKQEKLKKMELKVWWAQTNTLNQFFDVRWLLYQCKKNTTFGLISIDDKQHSHHFSSQNVLSKISINYIFSNFNENPRNLTEVSTWPMLSCYNFSIYISCWLLNIHLKPHEDFSFARQHPSMLEEGTHTLNKQNMHLAILWWLRLCLNQSDIFCGGLSFWQLWEDSSHFVCDLKPIWGLMHGYF